MNKLNDTSFINFLGNSPPQTATHICLLKTWQACEIKSKPRNSKMKRKQERGKSCLKGPPRELRISLSNSGVSRIKQIRQICTENLGATVMNQKLLLRAGLQLSCKRLQRHHQELLSLAKKMSHKSPILLFSNSAATFFLMLTAHKWSTDCAPRGPSYWNTGFHSYIHVIPHTPPHKPYS